MINEHLDHTLLNGRMNLDRLLEKLDWHEKMLVEHKDHHNARHYFFLGYDMHIQLLKMTGLHLEVEKREKFKDEYRITGGCDYCGKK